MKIQKLATGEAQLQNTKESADEDHRCCENSPSHWSL